MILVVFYTLGIALCVFYILWRQAVAKLKSYHFEGKERKALTISPMADTPPIISGQIDPFSKPSDEKIPIKVPPAKAKRISRSISNILKKSLSKGKMTCQSIKRRTKKRCLVTSSLSLPAPHFLSLRAPERCVAIHVVIFCPLIILLLCWRLLRHCVPRNDK